MNEKSNNIDRKPYTDEELRRFSPFDIKRLKLSDDEKSRLDKIYEKMKKDREEIRHQLQIEATPILKDLQNVNCNVDAIWKIKPSDSKQVLPILLKHLQLKYSDSTKEVISRKLATLEPEVQTAWSIILQEYKKAPEGWGVVAPGVESHYRLGAKNALAIALSVALTPDRLDEYISIIRDKNNGKSRIMLLEPLKKYKTDEVKKALEEFKNDPDLTKEIASWKRI